MPLSVSVDAGSPCAGLPTCTPAAPSPTSPTGCTRRPRTPRCAPAARSASRSPASTSSSPDLDGPEHVFIEANERPGLANHEPQPTAEHFIDLLFPETRRR